MKVTVDLSQGLILWIEGTVARGRLVREKYNRSDFIRDVLVAEQQRDAKGKTPQSKKP